MELKRDYSAHAREEDTSSKSLFQEYQYLTPGMFPLSPLKPVMRVLTVNRLVYGILCHVPFHDYLVRRAQGSSELGGSLCGF